MAQYYNKGQQCTTKSPWYWHKYTPMPGSNKYLCTKADGLTFDWSIVHNKYGLTKFSIGPGYEQTAAAIFGAGNIIVGLKLRDSNNQTYIRNANAQNVTNFHVDEPGRNGTFSDMQALVDLVRNAPLSSCWGLGE